MANARLPAFATFVRTVVLALLASGAAAQRVDIESASSTDSLKGPHTPVSMTPTERDAMFAPRALHADDARARQILATSAAAEVDRLHWDEPGDGRVWALGASFKASFGADGFTYVPWFGSDSPQNYPVRFVLRSARVGGRELSLAGDARAERRAERVTILRGLVQEHYDLTPRAIEQTIVVAGDEPGDVDVELEVLTELVEDAARSGIQFANELGDVTYGAAHLVRGAERIAIDTQWVDGRLRLHVPAELRGQGPVVIDPIISTHLIGQPLPAHQREPDIAFDASTSRYLVVWRHDFSATDSDVLCELRSSNGSYVLGSVIDITAFSFSHPRVANLAVAARFLAVTERYDPAQAAGLQRTIWGRTFDAVVSPSQAGNAFEISSPSRLGDKCQPDVGGDPSAAAGQHHWLVVWTRIFSGSDFDIHARLVGAPGTPIGATLLLENSGGTFYADPRVARSNANGIATRARWLVAYDRFDGTRWRVYGSVLDEMGVVTRTNGLIDQSSASVRYPSVSSPASDLASGEPWFLITFVDVNNDDLIARIVDESLASVLGAGSINLTQTFGFSGIASDVDSDGCRFAVAYEQGGSTWVGTLAYANGSLVLHEAPRMIGTGTSVEPALASARSGGGRRTDFGVVRRDNLGVAPTRIQMSIYESRAPGAGFSRRATGCQGLGLNERGRPYLGETMRFQITNVQADVVGLLVGRPGAVPLCTGCTYGLDPASSVVSFGGTAALDLTVPCDANLVGISLGVQGVATGSGTCLGFLRLSDTIDMVVR